MNSKETAVMRKAGLRGEMLMFSSAATVAGGQCQHQHQLVYLQSPPSAYLPLEEGGCAPVDRSGGLLWEDFSVDDLLDLGGGKEQTGGEDNFLLAEEAEEEKEEEEEDDEEERKDSATGFNTCSSSVLSYQAIPLSSDPMVPAGDVADLEWLSHFVDDSYSEFPSAIAPPLQSHHAPAPAPLEVAAKTEASKALSTGTTVTLKRTWGSCNFSTDSLVVPSKARSKRSRTGRRVWSRCLPPLFAESSSSSCSSGSSSASCSGSSSISSCLHEKLGSGGWGDPHRFLDCLTGGASSFSPHQPPPPQLLLMKKKKGRKPKALTLAAAAADGNAGGEPQTRRRCSHCGVDKTPQWRAGPMGSKTLCNACGVRYKSGRLLPEYRPAGSPSFLSHMHSNSHRKVLEMRRKKELLEEAAPSSPAPCLLLPPHPAVASQPYGVV